MKDLKTITLQITYWIDGEFSGDVFEAIAGSIPGVILDNVVVQLPRRERGDDDDWTILIESIEEVKEGNDK